MSRSNRLGGRSNVKELLAGRLMETIVEDVIKAKAMPFAEWHALSPNPPVPLAILFHGAGSTRRHRPAWMRPTP